ncbi:MAG: glycosyltransferase family 2 protein [Chloroflexota bacterium]
MVEPEIPAEVLAAARARADARARRDWATADRLRAEIEAAGYRVVDEGTRFELTPAHPPDVVDDGLVRYGSSVSVPSRLDEPPTGVATIVMVATDDTVDVVKAAGSMAEHAPDGTQVVIVAVAPSREQEAALRRVDAVDSGAPGVQTEVVFTSAPLGHAAALNAGIRRAAAPVVVLLDAGVEATGDFVTPLVDALADPSVGVAGGSGLTSADLRRFDAAPAGDVDAVALDCLAFRRDDARVRGPLDEAFTLPRHLDVWWSLVLRDEGEGATARRAVAMDLPLVRHEHRGQMPMDRAERERLSKRSFYRVIRRFGHRRDLLVRPGPADWRAARAGGREGR